MVPYDRVTGYEAECRDVCVTVELPPAAEVVIVGGGVIGVSCAFHLAAAGVEGVLLVEQETLGSGSTSKAAGGIRASFSTRCNIEMGLHGLAAYAEFSKRFDQEIASAGTATCTCCPTGVTSRHSKRPSRSTTSTGSARS